MSITVCDGRELAHVAVFYGVSTADLAVISAAHAAAVQLQYPGAEDEPYTVEEIEQAVAELRAAPHTLDRSLALRMPGLLRYNAKPNGGDFTEEEPYRAAFERLWEAEKRTIEHLAGATPKPRRGQPRKATARRGFHTGRVLG